MPVDVVAYDPAWPTDFERVAADLRRAVAAIPSAAVEHVGSTSVPGLAAKPILDIDVIVAEPEVPTAIAALAAIGYEHRGDLGLPGREAFWPPDDDPARHVYVCVAGGLQVRNHLAVRDILRTHDDLRDEYAAVKTVLAAQPDLEILEYIAGKTAVIQKILSASGLVTETERRDIEIRNNDLTRHDAKEYGT